MKVYELMNALSELPSGADVSVSICMTRDELEAGEMIEQGLYCRQLAISEIDDSGNIATEV